MNLVLRDTLLKMANYTDTFVKALQGDAVKEPESVVKMMDSWEAYWPKLEEYLTLNRNQAIVVVGLPGSGKLRYINKFFGKKLTEYRWMVIHNPVIFDTDILPWLEDGYNVIISDSSCCNVTNRMRAKKALDKYEYATQWIYFENAPEKCKLNLKNRGENHLSGGLDSFQYEIPEGVTPLTVWQPRKRELTEIKELDIAMPDDSMQVSPVFTSDAEVSYTNNIPVQFEPLVAANPFWRPNPATQ